MIIGLTGGIGSGKSTVAKVFSRCGFFVIDADKIGHGLLNKGEVRKEVLKEFGIANRKKLGQIVFNDKLKLGKLDKIMWSRMSEEIRKKARGKGKVIIEGAVLIESGWHRFVDEIVVVKISRENQMKRLIKNKRYSKQVIKNIINMQMSQSKRLKYADHIVDNNKSVKGLNRQVKGIVDKLK